MKSEERKKELQAQRKRLEAFDRTFQKENDFMTSGKTLFWIYVVFEIITFLIVVGIEGRMENIVGITTGFAICATGYYMRDYCYTTEQNKRVSLWKKVSAAPIERSVFVASRVGYLSRLLLKITPVAVLVQVIGALLGYGKVTGWQILYPIIAAGGIPFLIFFLQILCDTRKRKLE